MASGIQTASASAGTASPLSNSIRTQYIEAYLEGAMYERIYDQIAEAVPNNGQMIRGSSVQIQFLSDMEPGTTAISEVNDINPQTLRDGYASVTPTSRGEALQASELLLIQAFTPYAEQRIMKVGKNAMESIDLLAQAAATKGSFIERAAARASLDAGTTGHLADETLFQKAESRFSSLKVPNFAEGDFKDISARWMAIMHPAVYHDLLNRGSVVSILQYQNQDILFNYEMGAIGYFRLVVSPWAKVFYGAGADNGDSVIASSLKADANALAKEMTVSAAVAVHADTGRWLTIGTEETAGTHYEKNERVAFESNTTSVVAFVGEGPNGGLRFDHTTSDVVRNADSVYTIVFGGPSSLAKVYAPEVGEFGSLVGPKRGGLLDQFDSVGWKFYGQYGRFVEKNLLRAEVAVSSEA